MRVWVDLTNSPHVIVFRPLIALLRERGHEVEVTARRYAQTLQLLELHGIKATVVGEHGGASTLGKARVEVSRLRALRAWAKPRGFDVALAHGSHELTMTARRLGIPSSTTFDYEWAWLQHQLGCRAATRVVVPDAIPPDRLARATHLIEQAAAAGAQLVVLPELFNLGYEYSDRNHARAEAADGPTLTWMRQSAARLGIHVHLQQERAVCDPHSIYSNSPIPMSTTRWPARNAASAKASS